MWTRPPSPLPVCDKTGVEAAGPSNEMSDAEGRDQVDPLSEDERGDNKPEIKRREGGLDSRKKKVKQMGQRGPGRPKKGLSKEKERLVLLMDTVAFPRRDRAVERGEHGKEGDISPKRSKGRPSPAATTLVRGPTQQAREQLRLELVSEHDFPLLYENRTTSLPVPASDDENDSHDEKEVRVTEEMEKADCEAEKHPTQVRTGDNNYCNATDRVTQVTEVSTMRIRRSGRIGRCGWVKYYPDHGCAK